MPAKAQSNLWSKLIAVVRRDPQKAGILTVLVAILVVLQVRLQSSRGGPEQATAAAKTNNIAVASHADHSVKPIDPAGALRAFMDQPILPVKRNLFTVDLERFPRDSGRATSANTSDAGFWDELAKSMTVRADVKRERQILLENLAQQASQLRLQSTVMGVSPKAVIDGELVGEGDFVAAKSGDSRAVPGDNRAGAGDRITFRVLKIEARRIIVEREGIKLAIQMK